MVFPDSLFQSPAPVPIQFHFSRRLGLLWLPRQEVLPIIVSSIKSSWSYELDEMTALQLDGLTIGWFKWQAQRGKSQVFCSPNGLNAVYITPVYLCRPRSNPNFRPLILLQVLIKGTVDAGQKGEQGIVALLRVALDDGRKLSRVIF